MTWDKEYEQNKQLWGEQPSELALFAASFFKKSGLAESDFTLIDLGCGYGRDALYLCREFSCRILGLDKSPEAVRMAEANLKTISTAALRFQCGDFFDIKDFGRYDIVYASNLYQLLRPDERLRFRELVKKLLNKNGYLLMSTHSSHDPEHAGKGKPVPGDPGSFIDQKFLHLCDEAELRRDFNFLDIRDLFEQKFDEPRSTGETHHHISWILAGQEKG
jgi:SAM-dependent methyltransferase